MWKLPRGCLCILSILYFFRCSAIFLSFYVTLFVFISCPSTFLSSCALLPCPSIICSYPYPFIVPACHVQILTDRIFGMHDLGHHGGHNLYVWILKIYIHRYKNTSFRVRAISLVCPVLFWNHVKFPHMFVSKYVHSPWSLVLVIFFHARFCFFSVLYFFQRSSIFLSLYFTLFQCISFPSTFLSCALSSMSFHCLVISFHCPSMPCPKSHR